MSIVLRTFSADQNTAASTFVSIPRPVGVLDGDLLIAAIVVPVASFALITPPSDGWKLVAQTDTNLDLSVAVFSKVAMNEPIRWVFVVNSSALHTGGVLCFGGCDGWEPVEVSTSAETLASSNQNTPAISAALDGDEFVRLFGAKGNGSFTPSAGYTQAAAHATTGSSFAAHCRGPANAGVEAASTVSFSGGAVDGACVSLVLRPSVGKLSTDDVRQLLIDGFPDGFEDWADCEPGGDYYKLLQGIADVYKVTLFDLLDLVRQELLPHRSQYKLPDWERIFGLETSRITKLGTISDRQAQVLANWRAARQASTLANVQAAVQPFLKYASSNQIQYFQTSRSSLTSAHSYQMRGGAAAIPGPGSVSVNFDVLDSGKISAAGVHLFLNLTHSSVQDLSFTLLGPDGTSYTWAAGVLGSGTAPSEEDLYSLAFVGKALQGQWTLTVTSAANSGTLNNALLFVEGIGRNLDWTQAGLGGDAFEWGIFVDPTRVNNGAGGAVDYAAVLDKLFRFAQAHTLPSVIRGSTTISPGTPLAIPDDPNCVPNQCIPS